MLNWGIRHKSWLLPLLTILVIVYVSFFVGRYMDEFQNFHYLAYDNPAYKATEGTFLGYNDPSIFFLGKYEYKMSFFYVGKTSSFLFYPFYKIFPLEIALAIYNLVFYFFLCWLLKVACRWRNWQVWIFAFTYPVLFAFLHDGGPLKVSALAFPLTAIGFQYIMNTTGRCKKVFISILLGIYWSIALEDKIFFLYLFPSVLLFSISSLRIEEIKFVVLKRSIFYLLISFVFFLLFSIFLLSTVYHSAQNLWNIPENVTYIDALKIISNNQGGELKDIILNFFQNIRNGVYQGHYFRIFYFFLFSSRTLGIPFQYSIIAKAITIVLVSLFILLIITVIFNILKEIRRFKKIKDYNLFFVILSMGLFVLILSISNIYKYNGHHFFYFWILLFQFVHLIGFKLLRKASYYILISTSAFFYLLMFVSEPKHNTSFSYKSLGVKKYLDSLNIKQGYIINFSSLVTNFYSERVLEKRNEILTCTHFNQTNPFPADFLLYLKRNRIKMLNLCWANYENENLLKKMPIAAKSKLVKVFRNQYELRIYELDFSQ